MDPLIAESQASHTVLTAAHPRVSGGSTLGAAELGMRLRLSHPRIMESEALIYFSVSMSQLVF